MDLSEIIINDEQKIIHIDEKLQNIIKKAVDIVLFNEDFTIPVEVSITFVEDNEIRNINKQFRNKDKVTDVLSFPMLQFDENRNICNVTGDINKDSNRIILGDIIISTETAKRQSEKYLHSIEREIVFLVVHSMLHLMGYDHEKDENELKLMRKKEEDVLTEIGLKRD